MTTLTRLPATETQSLIVREIERNDTPAFRRYFTDERYQRHLAVRLTSEAEVSGFVRRCLAQQARAERRVFHLAAEGKHIRRAVGDGFIILGTRQTAEIGWGVDPSRWGRGLGTEIARVLSALAIERLGVEQVWCKVMAPNRPSLRVAEKAGFSEERVVGGYEMVAGQRIDVHVFRLSRQGYFDAAY